MPSSMGEQERIALDKVIFDSNLWKSQIFVIFRINILVLGDAEIIRIDQPVIRTLSSCSYILLVDLHRICDLITARSRFVKLLLYNVLLLVLDRICDLIQFQTHVSQEGLETVCVPLIVDLCYNAANEGSVYWYCQNSPRLKKKFSLRCSRTFCQNARRVPHDQE